jgi:hypothetical protein
MNYDECNDDDIDEAAAEITRLRADNERLQAENKQLLADLYNEQIHGMTED